MFPSRAEEIAALREFSDALVRNLFPKSLWGHEVHRCALNEIVAAKGKEALNSLLLKETKSSQATVCGATEIEVQTKNGFQALSCSAIELPDSDILSLMLPL